MSEDPIPYGPELPPAPGSARTMTLDEHLIELATLHGAAVEALMALQRQTDQALADAKTWPPAEKQVLDDWLDSICDDDDDA